MVSANASSGSVSRQRAADEPLARTYWGFDWRVSRTGPNATPFRLMADIERS